MAMTKLEQARQRGKKYVRFRKLSEVTRACIEADGFVVTPRFGREDEEVKYWRISVLMTNPQSEYLLADKYAPISQMYVDDLGALRELIGGTLYLELVAYREQHACEPMLLVMHPDDFLRLREEWEERFETFNGVPIEVSEAVPVLGFRFV
jgi:hypothetical protein